MGYYTATGYSCLSPSQQVRCLFVFILCVGVFGVLSGIGALVTAGVGLAGNDGFRFVSRILWFD